MLTVGTVIAGGFETLRTRPWAVAVWAAIYIAAAIAVGLAVRPTMAPMLFTGSNPDPQALANMMSVMSRLFLIELVYLVLILILLTAAMRAVLRPEAPGFAYIRLGGDEVRVVALAIFLFIAFYIAMVVVAIVMTLVVVALGAAAGRAVAAAAVFVEVLVLIGVFVYVEVRLSLALPLTLMRGQFVLLESWRLTRGRFWTLFGGYFVLFLILFVLWAVIASFTVGPYLRAFFGHHTDPTALQAAMQAQMAHMWTGPLALIIAAANGALGAIALAFFGGASATAARILAEPPAAATFE
jgi:hypothetical protein